MGNRTYCDPKTRNLISERRSGVERRSPAAFSSIFTRSPRRRKSRGRRKTDHGAYVDIYDSRTWSIAVAVLLLSSIDALMTGLHMVKGSAKEINPIMKATLDYGGLPGFFAAKAALTILPMAVIVIHKEWALGRYAARLCLWAYILLATYHLYLVFAIQKIRQVFLT